MVMWIAGGRQGGRSEMPAMRTTVSVAFALVFAFAVAAAGSASTKLDLPPTHFAGFPPEGVKASTPTTGRRPIGLGRIKP